jgi:hypothetical protein
MAHAQAASFPDAEGIAADSQGSSRARHGDTPGNYKKNSRMPEVCQTDCAVGHPLAIKQN